MRRKIQPFLLAISILFSTTAFSQQYRVGDIVENFTLINRATNQPLSLQDLEGNIVFLEWFAYWCPFCQAAAADVETGIVNYYKNRNGNANGVPVLHVGINLEGGPGSEFPTQAFIDRYGLGLVLNDFNRGLANRFQSGGQPIFAIINGVQNSPSNQQWELLYSRLGYGDFAQPISTFRQVIDSVQAAPSIQAPSITVQPTATRVATSTNLSLSVAASGDDLSYQWFRNGQELPDQDAATLTIEDVSLIAAGDYTVTVENAGGAVTSNTAKVEIVLSLADYLASAGLSGADLDAQADPDRDGYANAFEYLAQSDPNDRADIPNANLQFTESGGVPALRIQISTSAETLGFTLAAQFLAFPSQAGNSTQAIPLGQNTEILQPIPSEAKTFLTRLVATPSNN